MDSIEIANLYNVDGLSLKQIGEKLGMSKSTVQRRLIGSGWRLDRKQGKYVNSDNSVALEDNVDNQSNKKTDMENNVSRETNETEIVVRNYAISMKMDRALKIKAAIESKNVIDIVRAALDAYVEDKYLNM